MRVVCEIDKPEVLEYLDVFEEGDEWIKIKGCEECPPESRKKCCSGCKAQIPTEECIFQTIKSNLSKPYECVITPDPRTVKSYCILEFKCIKGKNEGKIRKLKDPISGI